MNEKKPNHQANIVRISELIPHTNADTLELVKIDGYQVVVKKGMFNSGDLGVYIQPDSVVPQTEPFRFIWEPYAIAGPGDTEPVQVSEKRRRVTVRKFRGEWSEGLLLPQSDFPELTFTDAELKDGSKTFHFEGDDVSTLLGITHYDPDKGRELTGDNEKAPARKKWPRSFRGWVYFLLSRIGIKIGGNTYGWDREYVNIRLPYYDVRAFKNFPSEFKNGETVVITEKIHGSNARYVYLDGRMYAGSRTLWKSPKSTCVWRKALKQNPWIEQWCKNHEGHVLYGEVVPTQGDKFTYGCKGEAKFFLFDIMTPNGQWVDYEDYADLGIDYVAGPNVVPFLYQGLWEHVPSLVDGPSYVSGARHIREGIVIKPLKQRYVIGLGRLLLKMVSNKFLEMDSK